ncbi:MAG TPA: hypothetical protein VK961_17085 [Chthoniobacter sp.]|nr:hypothetical protein [Chthoniobacter sp.]
MREDIPSRDLQDLHPIPGDGRVPFGWLRSIDRACTAWLLKRDMLGSLAEPGDTPKEKETGSAEEVAS